MMTRYLSVLAIMVLPLTHRCTAQVADSAKIVRSFTKCWRAFSHEYSTIYGLEEADISRYSKQRVCFTKDSVRTFLSSLYTPRYSVQKVNADDYAKVNFDCSKRKLGISMDSIYEVTIYSLTKPAKDGKVYKMTDVVAFDGDCIYMVVDGVIFKMVDADAKVRPSSSN